MLRTVIILCFFVTSVGVAAQDESDPIIRLLDSVFYRDQAGRLKMDSIQKKFGMESREMRSLFEEMRYNDSLNCVIVTNIIDNIGWPGPGIVGKRGASTIFLVIQHSDSLTQVTYAPKLREAVNNGKADPWTIALLEDRILTQQGKEQVYGSQLRWNETIDKWEFFPISDAANVNKRRAKVGLQPIEEYAKNFGIEYVPPKQDTKQDN